MREPPKTLGAALAYLYVCGAFLLTFFDGFHTFTGTTAYDSFVVPFARFAIWTPFLNGLALAGMGGIYAKLRLRRDPDPQHDLDKLATYPRAIVIYGALYLATGVLSGLFHVPTIVVSVVMLAGSIALFFVTDPTSQGALASAIAAVLGTAAEVVLVRMGAFHYAESQRDIAGAVPLWLPALYLGAGPSLGSWSTLVLKPFLRKRT